jgi:DNA polymerase (family 10)
VRVRPENARAAEIIEELADLSELAGQGSARVRALHHTAAIVHSLHEPLGGLVARGELGDLAGLGAAMVALITELGNTGASHELEEQRSLLPDSLLALLSVPGLDPWRVRVLWQELGVASLGELADACRERRLAGVEGVEWPSDEHLLSAANFLLEGGGYVPLPAAAEVARRLERSLRSAGASRVEAAGELRRGVELVTEVVLVVDGLDEEVAAAALERLAPGGVGAKADEGGFVTLSARVGQPYAARPVAVRLRLVPPGGFLSALLVETGDSWHLRWLARCASDAGLELSDLVRSCTTEQQVYRELGMPWVAPELRDGDGQVGAAPIERSDVRGVFHVHTDWSDGEGSLLEVVRAAQDAGLRFVGISDHSQTATYARGLDAARLREQAAAVRGLRREVRDVVLLHGVEVDILADGSLDLDDETLASLDFVVASVHNHLHQPPDVMTRRLLRAVTHPLVTMLGHPTGRLLGSRRGYRFDWLAVARAAAGNETYLEINANPGRLDPPDDLVRRAAAGGADFVINPDAHEVEAIGEIDFGVQLARRAGLGPGRVLNARDLDSLMARLEARRQRGLFALGLP